MLWGFFLVGDLPLSLYLIVDSAQNEQNYLDGHKTQIEISYLLELTRVAAPQLMKETSSTAKSELGIPLAEVDWGKASN